MDTYDKILLKVYCILDFINKSMGNERILTEDDIEIDIEDCELNEVHEILLKILADLRNIKIDNPLFKARQVDLYILIPYYNSPWSLLLDATEVLLKQIDSANIVVDIDKKVVSDYNVFNSIEDIKLIWQCCLLIDKKFHERALCDFVGICKCIERIINKLSMIDIVLDGLFYNIYNKDLSKFDIKLILSNLYNIIINIDIIISLLWEISSVLIRFECEDACPLVDDPESDKMLLFYDYFMENLPE